MTEEDEEFQRLEREIKMRRRAEEDDDIQVYKKPWVGLTDEEVVDLKMIGRDLEFVSMTALHRYAKDIEAKLKEKNT